MSWRRLVSSWKNTRRSTKTLLIIAIWGGGTFAWLMLSPLWNDYRFWQVRRQFTALKHSMGTQKIKYVEQFGNLSGTSNHCDYFIAEDRDYSGNKADKKRIQAFYSKTKLYNSVSRVTESPGVVFVDKVADVVGSDDFWLYNEDDLWQWGLMYEDPKRPHYIVYFFDSHAPGCDGRCG
ncbi:hypothetical protein IAD21_01271 [Abditibacteriota bacterium]|nr:hypothetical protein IAD21_01271 [Abditibacteriota bacterium]